MRTSLIVIALLITGICHAQSFEGKITYENSYKSNIPNVPDEQFIAMLGTVQEYYIKGERYKSIVNGSLAQWQLYVPLENRVYNKISMSDTLLWNDGWLSVDKVVSYEILKNQGEVLGYQCDALVVKTETGKSTLYFNKDIKIDPRLYKNHNYRNWSFFMSKTKSIPLKLEIETPQFNLVSIAIEINETELEDSFFDLPEVPVKKSPY